MLCYLLSWTKTNFANHQEYIELLEKHHSFGSVFFEKAPQKEFDESKYYWQHGMYRTYTAYSAKLTDDTYEDIRKCRREDYYKAVGDNLSSVIYVLENNKRYYIENAEWFDEADFEYIAEVAQNPETEQQYYFLIVVRHNTVAGISYTGVIMNDTTHEMIEFSMEIPEEELIKETEVEVPESEFSIDAIIEIVWMIKGIAEKLL